MKNAKLIDIILQNRSFVIVREMGSFNSEVPFTSLITHAHYFGNVYSDKTTFLFCFSDELDVFVRLVLYGIVLL